MDRLLKPCNPFQGVAYGQTPMLDLQIGPRYRRAVLEVIATAAAAKTLTLPDVLGDILLKIGGNPQRTHSAVQLNAINSSYGADYAANAYNYDGDALTYVAGVPQGPQAAKKTVFYLPIYFVEPWRKSYAAAEMFGWPTAWQDGSVVKSFTIEATIPAASANVLAGSAITLNAYAETDNVLGGLDATTKRPVQLITKWKRQGLVYSGSGDLVITNLNKREMYTQISLFSAYKNGKGPFAGNTPAQIILDQNDLTAFDYITKVKVEVDNRTVRDASKTINDQSLIENDFNENALPADRFDTVFDGSDLPSDSLIMESGTSSVKDFRVTATLATAAAENKTIQSLSQVYGAIE